MQLSDKVTLHQSFWDGTLKSPLLGVFVPIDRDNAYPSMDIDLSVDEVIDKNRSRIEGFNTTPDQRIRSAFVNFGPVFWAAVGGTKMSWDEDTSWAESAAMTMDDVAPPVLDEASELWQNFMEKFEAICSTEFPGGMVGPTDCLGPFDILAAMTGSETLCMECLMNPEKVAELASACTDYWLQMYDQQYQMLPKHDGPDGVATLFGMFCPGRGALWSEDFNALCGPDVYRDLVLPCDRRLASSLDTCYQHVHSGGIKCLEHVFSNEDLTGVEISNDPNGPALEELLEWAQEGYRRGKSIMLSNWERHLNRKQVELILSRIDPTRTIVTVDAEDMDQARLWSDMFRLGV